jgi:hypothetical protein
MHLFSYVCIYRFFLDEERVYNCTYTPMMLMYIDVMFGIGMTVDELTD